MGCNCGPSGVWPADFNGDGRVNYCDRTAFYNAWGSGLISADVNKDGGVDGADVEYFENRYIAASGSYQPCPSGF